MSSVKKSDLRMSAAEYVAWERTQSERHEFYAGEVFLQAGGTRNHSLISVNTLAELRAALRGRDCQAHGSDLRIHVRASGLYAYPNVSVVCEPIEGAADDEVSNPVLLVEVLSPSTADYDRGGKFGHYRQIPSLHEYLVIWQNEFRVEQHQRTDEGHWLLREIVGAQSSLQLVSLGVELSLSEIFDKVEFNVD